MRDMRAYDQVLHKETRIALETRALRRLDAKRLILVDHQLRAHLAATPAPPLAEGGCVALSMPLGPIFGRPGPPFNRAISSRCAATVRLSSVTSAKSRNTKLLSSALERASMSGGAIPPVTQKIADSRILHYPTESIRRSPQQKPKPTPATTFAPVIGRRGKPLISFKNLEQA